MEFDYLVLGQKVTYIIHYDTIFESNFLDSNQVDFCRRYSNIKVRFRRTVGLPQRLAATASHPDRRVGASADADGSHQGAPVR